MPKYLLLSGSHSRWEGKGDARNLVTYRPGTPNQDVIELTEDEAELPQWEGRLRPMGGKVKSAAQTVKPPKDWSGILTENTATVVAKIDAEDDPAEIENLIEVEEKSSNPRKGVLSAASARLEALEVKAEGKG